MRGCGQEIIKVCVCYCWIFGVWITEVQITDSLLYDHPMPTRWCSCNHSHNRSTRQSHLPSSLTSLPVSIDNCAPLVASHIIVPVPRLFV